MSEYKHTVAKQQSGGFAESPDQTTGNAGNPLLDDKTKNLLSVGVATVYGKRVVSTVFHASIGQLGGARLEEVQEAVSRLSTYAFLAVASGGFILPAISLASDIVVAGIENAVESHSLNLENDRLRASRGVRVNYNAGGYYG